MAGPHDKLIAVAAKQALEPLGYERKGQSRIWLADNQWWLGVVEFQPSAWGKGSYLNVAAHLLWSEGGHISFDYGGRVSEFEAFKNEEQFAGAAAAFAARAFVESQLISQSFASLQTAGEALVQAEAEQTHWRSGWITYHAAAALALLERECDADLLIHKIVDDPAVRGSALDKAANKLRRLIARPTALHDEMRTLVGRQRQALKFDPADNLPF